MTRPEVKAGLKAVAKATGHTGKYYDVDIKTDLYEKEFLEIHNHLHQTAARIYAPESKFFSGYMDTLQLLICGNWRVPSELLYHLRDEIKPTTYGMVVNYHDEYNKGVIAACTIMTDRLKDLLK